MGLVIILPVEDQVPRGPLLPGGVGAVVVDQLPVWSGIYIMPNQEITDQPLQEVLGRQQQQGLLVLVGTELDQHHPKLPKMVQLGVVAVVVAFLLFGRQGLVSMG